MSSRNCRWRREHRRRAKNDDRTVDPASRAFLRACASRNERCASEASSTSEPLDPTAELVPARHRGHSARTDSCFESSVRSFRPSVPKPGNRLNSQCIDATAASGRRSMITPSHANSGIRVCGPRRPNTRLMLDGRFGSAGDAGFHGWQTMINTPAVAIEATAAWSHNGDSRRLWPIPENVDPAVGGDPLDFVKGRRRRESQRLLVSIFS